MGRINEEREIEKGRRETGGIFCDRNSYSYWCGKSVSSSYLSIQFSKFQHFVIEIIFTHLLNPNRVKSKFNFNVPIIFISQILIPLT
jgi:hypothetical protein